jgi:hypothetical protein
MNALGHFLSQLNSDQKDLFLGFKTPAHIQAYLDQIPYRVEDDNYCALSVFRDGKAHCFDGSLFAAAGLVSIGYRPFLVQMLPEDDDDHMITVYKQNGRFGCLGKSNFVGLRSREPVYSSVRELVMSYFNDFYNLDGIFSLRGYTFPIYLKSYDRFHWMDSDAGAQVIVNRLHEVSKVRLLTDAMIKDLTPINSISFQAGMSITNLAGAYKPGVNPKKDFGL